MHTILRGGSRRLDEWLELRFSTKLNVCHPFRHLKILFICFCLVTAYLLNVVTDER